jgi:N-acetylglucosaminyl-diphospho-decaprenol L-rhamnosyltransferase
LQAVEPSSRECPTETGSIPELSVVIASWNSWGFLKGCLPSVLNQGPLDLEIIVVDNGSVDGTPSRLREHYPSVKITQNKTNESHSRAMNKGIRLARGKYVLVLDADTVVAPGAFRRLLEFMREHPDTVIAAPKMFNGDGTVQETARNFPKPINALFGRQTFLARLFPNNRFSSAYVVRRKVNEVKPYEVDWVSSACMIFSRALAERIGFWDEGYKSYWDEADWCKQAHAAGKICCVPEANVTHFYQNRTGKKKGVERIVDFHCGAHRFYWKHYTRGPLDPRSVIAGMALAVRAGSLILVDVFRQREMAKG